MNVKEWSTGNKYNPMNSAKGMTYYENYKKILAWMDGKGKLLPPPIEASLDPTSACNNHCYYCSSNRYLKDPVKQWDWAYLKETMYRLAKWGVKAYCWGGREATLNKDLADATRLAFVLGLEGAIVTNGVHLPDDLLRHLLLCKWIGVSVDTDRPDIYKKVRGTDDCKKVWNNIARLAAKKVDTTLGVRALVLPETVETLISTTLRARESGASFIHIRPADLERQDLNIEKHQYDVETINELFQRCHEFESKSFKVFTITHKYDEGFHVRHNFKRCLASPLVVQLCADRKMYLCVDHRMDARYEIEEWGSDQHRELIKSIVPDRDCSRCTWGEYNRICEEVIINDSIHRNFP